MTPSQVDNDQELEAQYHRDNPSIYDEEQEQFNYIEELARWIADQVEITSYGHSFPTGKVREAIEAYISSNYLSKQEVRAAIGEEKKENTDNVFIQAELFGHNLYRAELLEGLGLSSDQDNS